MYSVFTSQNRKVYIKIFIDLKIVYKIQTGNAGCNDIQARLDEDEPPPSVIHAPAGFGDFLSNSPVKVHCPSFCQVKLTDY